MSIAEFLLTDINVRFQIASILFVVLMLMNFLMYEKLPLLSTKFFAIALFGVFLELIFDITTVYTLTNIDKVAPWQNRLAHQLFIAGMDALIFSLFFYIKILADGQKRPSLLQKLICVAPLFISLLVIIFGDLSYVVNEKGIYSYGSVATTIYISAAIYLIASIIITFGHNELEQNSRWSIRCAMVVCILITLFQFNNKYVLSSGLSFGLMFLLIFMSFENPKEHRDQETKCFNKRAYHLLLSEYFSAKKPFYVLDIVVNNMQNINNKYGHDIGHKVLTQIAMECKPLANNLVFHSRGNTLTLLLRLPEEEKIADKIANLTTILEREWNVDGNGVATDLSINVLDVLNSVSSKDEVYDITLYVAGKHVASKDKDKHVEVCYIDEQQFKANQRFLTIYNILQTAIANDGINIVYQPIYSTKRQKFISAEALVRLKDTQTIGFIPPDEFITVAEEKGLINDLGDMIFENICRFAYENNLVERGVEYIEVNISALQGMDTSLPDKLKNLVEKYNLTTNFFNLEITETAAIESMEMLAGNMSKLKSYGFWFSMDDFGTGYSNLAKLFDENYELIKFDKSLIWPYFEAEPERNKVLLPGAINLIKDLGGKIVAEGVETKEMVDMLTEHGVDYLQGYYFSKPIGESDYLEFLKSH